MLCSVITNGASAIRHARRATTAATGRMHDVGAAHTQVSRELLGLRQHADAAVGRQDRHGGASLPEIVDERGFPRQEAHHLVLHAERRPDARSVDEQPLRAAQTEGLITCRPS